MQPSAELRARLVPLYLFSFASSRKKTISALNALPTCLCLGIGREIGKLRFRVSGNANCNEFA